MENKLKKLGKYFTKGLLTGVLATALMAGTAGCSNAAGGNDTEFTGGNGGEQTETGWTQPAYMNVTAEFGGQRFIEEDKCFNKNSNKDANFDTYYKNAKNFMDAEVTKLNDLNYDNSTLYDQINTVFQDYSKASTIANNIDQNYTALAPVFKAMRNNLTEDKDYNRFNVTYWKLAADAYNQSLGEYAGETVFPTNAELRETTGNFFLQELNDANLSYADATDSSKAQERMNNYLKTIASKTNTNVTVLKKIVELALYNESLYGLNDHAVQGGVSISNKNLENNKRALRTFDNKISNYSLYNIQSIDDRTM